MMDNFKMAKIMTKKRRIFSNVPYSLKLRDKNMTNFSKIPQILAVIILADIVDL